MIWYEVGHERLFQGNVLIILGIDIIIIEHIVVLRIDTAGHERGGDQEEESVSVAHHHACMYVAFFFSHDQPAEERVKIGRLLRGLLRSCTAKDQHIDKPKVKVRMEGIIQLTT